MSTIIIELFDERTIGRNFQIAALGSIYGSLAEELKQKIEKGLETNTISLSVQESDNLFKTLASYLENYVCKAKSEKPEELSLKLYTAGHRDTSILSSIGMSVSRQKLSCHTLVEYYRNGLLMQNLNKTTNYTPMLFRTYVFSKFRDDTVPIGANTASLYLALAGAIMSMLAKIKKTSGVEKADEYLEFYVIPDGSLESLRASSTVYPLLYVYSSMSEYYHNYFNSISNLSGLSLEIAALLSCMLKVYTASLLENASPITSLLGTLEKFKIVSLEARHRPLIYWERALAISHHLMKLDTRNAFDVLKIFYELSLYAEKISNEIEEYEETISRCINNVYGYLETDHIDILVDCSSSIARVIDKTIRKCKKTELCNQVVEKMRYLASIIGKLAG